MLVFRNILFAVAFYVNCVFWFLLAVVGYVLPQRFFVRFCWGWANSSMWLFRMLIGARIEIRGREHIPQTGALVAAKHQSAFETFALLPCLEYPAFIYKRELNWVPLFGWHLMRLGCIAVDRGGSAEVLKRLVERTKLALAAGRQIIIFPEGTRKAVGAPLDYKIGVAQLYRTLGVPCVPVALNSGLAWPRRRFLKQPYTVVMEFLEPIPAGMPAKAFHRLLQERIEDGTNRLVAEALDERGQSLSEIQSSNVS